jgi:tetratricopeptide (TPR) repeat protein
MSESLAEGALPLVLRDLYVARKTGMLHFRREDERRSFRFRIGQVVRADTTVLQDRLGDVLVRAGLLSAQDLKRASGFVLRDRKRLGVVLQELGLLDRSQVEDAVALHLRENFLKVLAWPDGECAFEEDTNPPGDEDATTKLPTAEMILESVRSLTDPDLIRYHLGNLDRILTLPTDPMLRMQKVTLSPGDGYVLSRVDGSTSAREILQMIPQDPEETQRSLLGLLCIGMVEFSDLPPKPPVPPLPHRPEPPAREAAPQAPAAAPLADPPPASPAASATDVRAPERERKSPEVEAAEREILEAFEGIKTRTHFEILGLPRACNDAEVKEAYFRLAKRFHPDAHRDQALAPLKEKLSAVFIRLGEAYEVLRTPRTRSEYESRLPRPASAPTASQPSAAPSAAEPRPGTYVDAAMVEDAVRRAERLQKEEKYWDAIQLIEGVLSAAEGRLKSKAKLVLARAYAKNPKWTKRAEELLQTVLHEDPKYGEPYYALGLIYKEKGLKSRATSMFRKVLELKPEHEEAAAELATLSPELEAPPPAEGGGLIKRLFGKGS